MIIKFVCSRIQIATSFRIHFFHAIFTFWIDIHFFMSIFSSNIHIFVKFSVLAWYNCREESFRLDETIDDPFFKSDDVRWCPVIIGFKQHLSLVRFGQWVGPEIIFWIERHIRTILAARMCHQLSQNCHIVLFQMKFSFKSFYKNKLYFPNKNIININSKYHSF